jgi:hypothetical protein
MASLIARITHHHRRRQIRRLARLLVELDAAGVRSPRVRATLRASVRY